MAMNTLERPQVATPSRQRPRLPQPIDAAPLRIALAGVAGTVLAVIASEAFAHVVWPLLLVAPFMAAAAIVLRRRGIVGRVAGAAGAVVLTTLVAGMAAGASLGGALTGAFGGPRRLFTTEWPSPRDPAVVMAVALLIATVTAAAAELAGRRLAHVAPLVIIAGGLAAAMALAAPVRPSPWSLAALAAPAIALLIVRGTDDLRTRPRQLTGEWSLPITLALVVGVAVGVGAGLAWADRADPRRTPPAEVTSSLLDSIEQMVAVRNAEPVIELFRVSGRGDEPLPERWRLGTVDVYDGQRWVPSVELRAIGGELGLPSPAGAGAQRVDVDVEFLTDDFDVLPLPGRPLTVDAGNSTIESDSARSTVRFETRPAPGLRIRMTAERAPTVGQARTADITARQIDELSAEFTDSARALAGDGTVLDQLSRIESAMRDEWQLDRGAPGPGQQLALLQRFVTDTRRGTDEQFVAAFTMMARSLGVEARVATGFRTTSTAGPLVITSADAAVWPEVRLGDNGWLAFDPVPETESTSVEVPPPPPAAQSPAAAQPPIPPPAERAGDDDRQQADAVDESGRWSTVRGWVVKGGVVAGIGGLPFALAIGTVLGIKWRRRRRRLRSDDPRRRIVGAWANATDSLIDAGLTISGAWTDDGIAEHAAALAPGVPHEMRRLAAAATAATFGPTHRITDRASDHHRRLAEDAVATWRTIDTAIHSSRTRWQRIRWRLSLRSLRRRTRSPIPA